MRHHPHLPTIATVANLAALALLLPRCSSYSSMALDVHNTHDAANLDASSTDVVQPPADCDVAAEPKDAPKCVVSEMGVFVDAQGNDDNAGTKEAPVKTIAAAGAKTRVYLCEGAPLEGIADVYTAIACSQDGASPSGQEA